MKSSLLSALMLTGVVALAPMSAQSQARSAQQNIVQGPYTIAVYQIEATGNLRFHGCLVKDGDGTRPRVFDWGDPTCVTNKPGSVESRWNVYKGDKYGHVIKSAMTGECLIRGDQGREPYPTLYRWTNANDNVFCGLSDRDEFQTNGQASWYLDVETYIDAPYDLVTYSGRLYLGTPSSERFPGLLAVGGEYGQLTFSTDDRSWIFNFRTIAP